jgi:hopene-associated glycosyltransferase HpnB
MNDALVATAALSLASWVYLSLFHGRFWRADQRLGAARDVAAGDRPWPEVAAVIPARDEEDSIARSAGSVLAQDYPGRLSLVVVDDQSGDATARVARQLGARHPRGDRLRIVGTAALPAGWVGKMWAVETGVREAARRSPRAVYLLLTDADVELEPGTLRRLVAKAESERLDLVSLMVRLHCQSGWERLLIPAFVYFFQKLYPFPRINDRDSRQTGAAGGCMLVRREALERAGGIDSVRGEIIDDCALGARLKRGGPVWVGLAGREISFRPYRGLGEIWNMVARSAYTQLRRSPGLLAATVLGLALVYLVPPLVALGTPWHANAMAGCLGAAAWALMASTYLPTLRLYGLSAARSLTLPAAALLYLLMTVDSARRHRLGRGAHWKGRAGAGDAHSGASG